MDLSKTIDFSGDNEDQRLATIILELARDDGQFCELYHFEDWDVFNVIDVFLNEDEPFNKDSRFRKIRNKAVSQWEDEHRHHSLKYSKLRTKQKYPPVWIKSNKGIWINLNRKGNQYFLPLYEILMESRIKRGEKGTPVLVKPDYDFIKQKLKLKKKDAYRYIREMIRWGIIKRHHREGRNGPWFYSLGIWMPGKGRTPRPIYFLKEKTPGMKHALIHFDAQREQR